MIALSIDICLYSCSARCPCGCKNGCSSSPFGPSIAGRFAGSRCRQAFITSSSHGFLESTHRFIPTITAETGSERSSGRSREVAGAARVRARAIVCTPFGTECSQATTRPQNDGSRLHLARNCPRGRRDRRVFRSRGGLRGKCRRACP